jgi:hypothetical protein
MNRLACFRCRQVRWEDTMHWVDGLLVCREGCQPAQEGHPTLQGPTTTTL